MGQTHLRWEEAFWTVEGCGAVGVMVTSTMRSTLCVGFSGILMGRCSGLCNSRVSQDDFLVQSKCTTLVFIS